MGDPGSMDSTCWGIIQMLYPTHIWTKFGVLKYALNTL